jgi:hypothetical protein
MVSGRPPLNVLASPSSPCQLATKPFTIVNEPPNLPILFLPGFLVAELEGLIHTKAVELSISGS